MNPRKGKVCGIKKMIEIAIKIGYIIIGVLVAVNLYYAIRIADIKYGVLSVFDRLKAKREGHIVESITWNQK